MNFRPRHSRLLALLFSLGLAWGCTLADAECDSDEDCQANAQCATGGGVFASGGICMPQDLHDASGSPSPDAGTVDPGDADELLDGSSPPADSDDVSDDPDAQIGTDCLGPDQTDCDSGCVDYRSDLQICSDAGVECGTVDNACGDPTDCGSCTGEQFCHQDICVECVESSQCDDDEICTGNACHLDVDCTSSDQCSSNQSCDNGVCVCSDARSDSQICSDEGAHCGTVTDVCNDNINCGTCSGGDSCIGNQCVECTTNGDCTGCQTCSNNQCSDDDDQCTGCQSCSGGSCNSDSSNCPDGICSGSTCVECSENSHCDNGVCADNECVECESNSNCDDGVCADNECVECTSDNHCDDVLSHTGNESSCCDGGQSCTCQNHVWQVFECTDDYVCEHLEQTSENVVSDCSSCGDGVCSIGDCVDCEDDDDCTDGYCLDNECVECTNDGHCDGSTVCLDGQNECGECSSGADCDGPQNCCSPSFSGQPHYCSTSCP